MSTGMEVVLGWTGGPEYWGKIADDLGLLFENPIEGAPDLPITQREMNVEFTFDIVHDPNQEALFKAHAAALKALGFKNLEEKMPHKYNTVLGPREFSPFELEVTFDPEEMGDELKDAVLGISLSGCYLPTFLDWRNPHGGFGVIEMDQPFRDMVAIAARQIRLVLPVFATANQLIVMRHN